MVAVGRRAVLHRLAAATAPCVPLGRWRPGGTHAAPRGRNGGDDAAVVRSERVDGARAAARGVLRLAAEGVGIWPRGTGRPRPAWVAPRAVAAQAERSFLPRSAEPCRTLRQRYTLPPRDALPRRDGAASGCGDCPAPDDWARVFRNVAGAAPVDASVAGGGAALLLVVSVALACPSRCPLRSTARSGSGNG